MPQQLDLGHSQTQTLIRTLNRLSRAESFEAVVVQVLGSVAEQLQSPWVTLWFHDQKADQLRLHAMIQHGEIRRPDIHMPAAEAPLWRDLFEKQQPILIEDIHSDPRVIRRAALEQEGIISLLLIPLLSGGHTLGWMSIRGTQQTPFNPDQVELAQALSHQITLASQLSCLAEQQGSIAVLEERNRMAQEIHDTLAQGLTGIILQLQLALDMLAGNEAQPFVNRAYGLAQECLSEARRAVRALKPEVLEQRTLHQALGQLVQRLTAGTPTEGHFQMVGSPCSLAAEVERHLFRIGQEAITNAMKHAHASHISLRLVYAPGQVCLQVEDDGSGFDVQKMLADLAERPGGFGLAGMSERAKRIHGHLHLESQPGIGTKLRVCVPVTAPAATEDNRQ